MIFVWETAYRIPKKHLPSHERLICLVQNASTWDMCSSDLHVHEGEVIYVIIPSENRKLFEIVGAACLP
jgi:hypothetical protein